MCNVPRDVAELRDLFKKTWEADIVFQNRYNIDKVTVIDYANPRVMFLDIETDTDGKVPIPQYAKMPVICLTACVDNIYTSFIFKSNLVEGTRDTMLEDNLHEIVYCKTEEDLFERFLDYFEQQEPDIISGWNCSRFDIPYLVHRMDRLGIYYDNKLSPMGSVYIREYMDEVIIKGVAIVDLYDLYRRFTENMEESYKLDFIGKKILGRGKTETGSNVRWLWKHELENLITYNAYDTWLCVEIDKKMKLIDFLDEMRRLCFCQYEDCASTSRMADNFILNLFHGEKIFPTKIKHTKQEFEGALVESHAKGIYDNVIVFDLKSLYPSIMVSANLSPETIDGTDQDPLINKIHVRQEPKGFLPEVIDHLFGERAKYKNLMKVEEYGSDDYKMYDSRQKAVKVLMNALYGQTAYPGSRIYDERIAETVTWMGRQIITWSKNFIENPGYKVLYIDTDSLSWMDPNGNITSESIQDIEHVLDELNKSYDEFAKGFGLTHHIFIMEFEKIYKRAFFGSAKKRYAAHVCYQDGKPTDRLHVMGFEIRRSDASTFSKEIQKEVFEMLLRQGKTKNDVLSYLAYQIEKIRSGEYSFEEIGIPKGISRELDDYVRPAANIRGALYARDILKIELSSKPKMIYVRKFPDNLPQVFKGKPADVLCFDSGTQIPPGTEIDTEKMLEKLVKDKVKSVFEALGWSLRDLGLVWRGKALPKGEQLTLSI
jgi:DNA polymerase I